MVEEDSDDYPPHQQQNVLTVAEFQTLKYLLFPVLPKYLSRPFPVIVMFSLTADATCSPRNGENNKAPGWIQKHPSSPPAS